MAEESESAISDPQCLCNEPQTLSFLIFSIASIGLDFNTHRTKCTSQEERRQLVGPPPPRRSECFACRSVLQRQKQECIKPRGLSRTRLGNQGVKREKVQSKILRPKKKMSQRNFFRTFNSKVQKKGDLFVKYSTKKRD